MDIIIILFVVIFLAFYLFRPFSKTEKDNFENKRNWRGGF